MALPCPITSEEDRSDSSVQEYNKDRHGRGLFMDATGLAYECSSLNKI